MRIKKICLLLVVLIFILLLPNIVNAYETTTSDSTQTFNWSYDVNEEDHIVNLRCTNKEAITGDITIPDTIDGKTVIDLGTNAFESATQITGVTIPSSVKFISESAFENCTNLSEVNLGQVEELSYYSFKDCTSLTKIKIPKTLKTTDAYNIPAIRYDPIFKGCINLKEVELEEGLTIIPVCLLANLPIEQITIPNTVNGIAFNAFEDCTNLKSITLPNSVKFIQQSAFENCTNLSEVNLGQVEELSYYSFKDCTSLTKIKIPKTLKTTDTYHMIATRYDPIFIGCKNLKEVELEEGLTIIPRDLLSTVPIEEITIPTTVKTIDVRAFKDCTNLNNITILDNVTSIGSRSPESVFQNHNEDLTIYCYRDSAAHQHAIKYNIKYVLLEKPTVDNNDGDGATQKPTANNKGEGETKNPDTTIANKDYPKAGKNKIIFITISFLAISSVIAILKYYKYRDIK